MYGNVRSEAGEADKETYTSSVDVQDNRDFEAFSYLLSARNGVWSFTVRGAR
jgi:hypothetical protein